MFLISYYSIHFSAYQLIFSLLCRQAITIYARIYLVFYYLVSIISYNHLTQLFTNFSMFSAGNAFSFSFFSSPQIFCPEPLVHIICRYIQEFLHYLQSFVVVAVAHCIKVITRTIYMQHKIRGKSCCQLCTTAISRCTLKEMYQSYF